MSQEVTSNDISKEFESPNWVLIFSGLFLVCFFFIPLSIKNQFNHEICEFGLFGITFSSETHHMIWFFLYDLIYIFGGITSVLILGRERFAYDFGIFYCIFTFVLVTISAVICMDPKGEDSIFLFCIQMILLLVFLKHLIQKREAWKSNKSMTQFSMKKLLVAGTVISLWFFIILLI